MFVMSKILQKFPAPKIFIDISKKKNINIINNILNTKILDYKYYFNY